jgi:hypothetical protein
MQLVKTEKAWLELSSKQRTLQVRERGALLLADGTKTKEEMQTLLQDDGRVINKLIAEGFLTVTRPGAALPPNPTNLTNTGAWDVSTGSWSTTTNGFRASQSAPQTGPAPLSPQPPPPPPAAPAAAAPAQAASDSFEGKRSLATTRMFLFDICERMFARKLPAKANLYRDLLREARDRDSMLAVARDMITDVEEIAGHERADGISERIAMLLPPE